MLLRVDCEPDDRGEETPCRVHLDGRTVEVEAVVDRWLAPDHRYFKILGSDGATYILRHNVTQDAWELTLYQSPQSATRRSAGNGMAH